MNNTITHHGSSGTNIMNSIFRNSLIKGQLLSLIFLMVSLCYYPNVSNGQAKQAGHSQSAGNKSATGTAFKKNVPRKKFISKVRDKFAFGNEREEENEEDGPGDAALFEYNRTKDPATGTVPTERLITALDQTIQMRATTANKGGGAPSTNFLTPLSWSERGPYTDAVGPSNGNTRNNSGITGGRVRAICVDSGDVNKKTVWVGGIDGGLWKTTDITVSPANWILVNDYLSNLAVSGICQDPTNVNIMYFCTGESYYNFDAVAGVGVFKSTDHGVTWNLLASTTSFTQCTRILCDASGNVYLATRGSGLRRSTNGGTTWTNITPSSAPNSDICDLELSSTGRLHMVTGIFTTQAYRYTDIPATVTSAVGWNSPATALPTYFMRAEIAVNGNTLYAAPADNGYEVPTIYKSTDGGVNWAATAAQPTVGWASGQGWYSLSVRINPADANQCIVGGLDNYKTTDGGATWSKISVWVGFSDEYVHADQHELAWWDGGNKMLFGCDGGVHYSSDVGTTIRDRNIGLRVKQFYSVAIHPSTTNYFLGGTQDNGTHQLTQPGLSNSTEVTGGDGAFVAIDQDEPQYQYGAYVYNQYRRSTNGGATWSSVNFSASQGQFINPFEYDNTANVMYCGNSGGNYRRWTDPHTGSTNAVVTITALNSNEVTALCVSPYTANRLYLGTQGGTRICYVDNANTVASGAAGTNISTGLPASNVTTSCIAVGTSDQNLMVCFSNYGVQNVWVSTNGGTSWTAIDGNLPDMPVRWCMFYPGDNTKAYIATETGVWETDLINGGSTVWASNSTFPTVRTDMIRYRASDRTIAAATHGRGIWTATVPLLCDPPVVTAPTVTQPTCATTTGTIVVNATNASSMEYSIDNGANWQSSATFSGLAGGNYNIVVRLVSQPSCSTAYASNPVVINTVIIPDATISASNGLALNCSNPNTVLTVPTPGGTTQIWTLNGNFFASAFNPLVTVGGVYAVTVTHTASGCTASSSVTVTLDNTPPDATISTSNGLTFCTGGNTVLTVPTPGGTTQIWTLNGNFFASAFNPLVTVGGVYAVTVTKTVNGCTATSSVTVTVNPNPAPPVSGGDVTVCASALPATLVDIVPNGINVNWWDAATGGNLLLANSATYTTSTPGTYYNEAVDPLTGCVSVTRTAVTLTVNPNPAPPVSGGDVTVCASALPATLVDIVPNGINVNWWDAATGGNLLLANSATYTTSTPGTYYNEAVNPVTGCISVTRTAVTLAVNPNPVPIINGPATACGLATLIATAGFNSYLWSTGSTNQSINVNVTGTYTVTVTNAFGCTGTATKSIVMSGAVPPQPGIISGAASACINSNVSYSIALVAGASSYTWSATNGASVSTGQGSANVVIHFPSSGTSTTLSVVANNACGASIARTLTVSISSVAPVAPVSIAGTLYGLCNQTNVPYSCPAVAGATTYNWSVPSGVTILSGAGTNSITVKFTGTFTTSGVISVAAANGCGTSAAVSRTLNARPQQPVISGLNWACKGQPGLTYSVSAVPGASSYTWTPVPGSTIVSGQGTTSIVYNWGIVNGVIKCKANNGCGSSLPASFSVSFTCKEAGMLEDFSEISLYPNPATQSVTVQFDGYAEGKGQLEVYDLIGQQMIKDEMKIVPGINEYHLDLTNYAKGVYTVKVVYNGIERNTKLTVQ